MRAALERNTAIGTPDEYGMPSPAAWAALATVPAWLWTAAAASGAAAREVVNGQKTAVVEDTRMLVPKGTDVSAKDRVNGVTDRLGAVIRPGVWLIESVVRRVDHLELLLVGIES